MVRKIKDIPWTVPDEIKNYIQFQATNDPVCPWAEGLAKKYHALAVFRYVFIARPPELLWSQFREIYGIGEVDPNSLRRFCEQVISYDQPNQWIQKLNEVMPCGKN